MNITMYVFIALLILLINEYRLIKKYIIAISNPENAIEKTIFQKTILLLVKPVIGVKNWIDNKVLSNDLNY